MANNEPLGIYGKYRIEKTDGTPIDPQAQYFVLRLDTDRAACEAMRTYAHEIRRRNPILSRELTAVLDEMDGRVHDARHAAERAARRNGSNGTGNGGAR
jgi:hypothetical protein